jgi:hypothetical protein
MSNIQLINSKFLDSKTSFKLSFPSAESLKDIKPDIELIYPEHLTSLEGTKSLLNLDKKTRCDILVSYMILSKYDIPDLADKIVFYKSEKPILALVNNSNTGTCLRVDLDEEKQKSKFSEFCEYYIPPPMFIAGYVVGLVCTKAFWK